MQPTFRIEKPPFCVGAQAAPKRVTAPQ